MRIQGEEQSNQLTGLKNPRSVAAPRGIAAAAAWSACPEMTAGACPDASGLCPASTSGGVPVP